MAYMLDGAQTRGAEYRGVVCCGCKAWPIYGTRHKCVECLNYDLCETCLSSSTIRSQHDGTHHLFPIEYPWDHSVYRTISLRLAPPRHYFEHWASCDGCGHEPIIGVRHKCLVCNDFDFCASCFADAKKHANHDITHAFFPIIYTLRYSNNSIDDSSRYQTARRRLQAPSDQAVSAVVDAATRQVSLAYLSPMDRLPVINMATSTTPSGLHNNTRRGMAAEDLPARCSACDQHIVHRPQHICTECPGFALCEICVSLVWVRSKHNPSHHFRVVPSICTDPMVPGEPHRVIPRAGGKSSTVPPLSGVTTCHGCWMTLDDCFYRCLVCPDIVMCTLCIEDPAKRLEHNVSHPFLPLALSGNWNAIYQAARYHLAVPSEELLVALDQHSARPESTSDLGAVSYLSIQYLR